MEARFSLAVRFAHPPLETPIPALACRPAVRGPRSALRIAEGGQPRQRPRRGARLVTFNPDTDQIAREIVALLQTVERLASQKLLRDLTLKFDAVRAIPDHELSSFESPACRSNVKSAHVPPQGPTPCLGQLSAEINTRTLQLDIATLAVVVYDLAKENCAAVAKLRNEIAELMRGVGHRDRLGAQRNDVAGKHRR